MFSKALSITVVALAASVSCQTHTSCDPTKKTCPADPAFGQATSCDFTKGACSIFNSADGTTLAYKDNGAVFSISSETQAPTVSTGKYLFFGRVDVVVQAAPGAGIVTSSVLQSDDLDEIDWEFVGSDNTQVQTNYFSKGDTTTYDRGAYHPVGNPTGQFHTYTVEWTSQQVNWLIDGQSVRVLSAATVGAKFPQTPMQVKLGTWCAGGKNSAPGTREWAGGYTDFSKAPFNAYYKSISITDYAGKDAPANGGIKEYIYGDNSGSWQSIKVVQGDGSSDSSSSSSAAASSTKASSTQAKTSSVKATSTSAPHSSTTEAKTTMTTATSASGNSTSGTSTDAGSQSSATTTPSTVPKNAGTAVSHGAAASLALLAGAGIAMAQLFL